MQRLFYPLLLCCIIQSNAYAQKSPPEDFKIVFQVYRSPLTDIDESKSMRIKARRHSIKQLTFQWEKGRYGRLEPIVVDTVQPINSRMQYIDRNTIQETASEDQPKNTFAFVTENFEYSMVGWDSTFLEGIIYFDFDIVYYDNMGYPVGQGINVSFNIVVRQESSGKVRIKAPWAVSDGLSEGVLYNLLPPSGADTQDEYFYTCFMDIYCGGRLLEFNNNEWIDLE